MDRIQQIEQSVTAKTREEFIQEAIKQLLIPEDITSNTEVTETLIMDTCRGRVFYVPELVGKEVPRVNIKGNKYKDIPNLPLVVCPAPDSFKAPEALVSQAMSNTIYQESSDHDIAHESLRHIQFAGKSIQTLV